MSKNKNKNEIVLVRKGKKKGKSIPTPVFDLSKKRVMDNKNKWRTKVKVAILVCGVVTTAVYTPQFFLSENEKSEKQIQVPMKRSAVNLSTSALLESPDEDFDGDGIPNSEETNKKTNPYFIDSDGDHISDCAEVYVTKTNPLKPNEGYLESIQKENDKKAKKSLHSPYKIANVILWADSWHSKAYGSVVETSTGYQFSDFTGYAQFPTKNMYAYRINKDGVHELLQKNENSSSEDAIWKIEADDKVELYKQKLKEITDVCIGKKHFYLESGFAKFLGKILPSKGFLTAVNCTKIDVEPDTRENVVADIVNVQYDEQSNQRLKVTHNRLNDLQYVRETIKAGNCVLVSLFSPGKGEYVGIVYGYTFDGNLLIADYDSLKPIGSLKISERSKKIMNADGSLVSYAYFDFYGLGFDSESNEDRINFFAATGKDFGENLLNRTSE